MPSGTFSIAKAFTFSASHELRHLPDEHKCHRNHGHNYVVTVVLCTDQLDPDDFVVDYGDLRAFGQWLDSTFDHRLLNDIIEPPTAEVLAYYVHNYAQDNYPWGEMLDTVTVQETDGTMAAYTERAGLPMAWTP